MGHAQFPSHCPGQPSGSRRWHPCCRRCLLKGCERWFLPRWPQARYCSPACQHAARRWRRWHASQRYRATTHGKATPPRPGPTLSQPSATAIHSRRAGTPNPSRRAGLPGGRGRATPRHRSADHIPAAGEGQRPDEFRKNPGPALRPARLLRRLPLPRRVPHQTLLFLLLSPGVTTRPTAGSPTPAPPAARWPAVTPPSSWTAGHAPFMSSHVENASL